MSGRKTLPDRHQGAEKEKRIQVFESREEENEPAARQAAMKDPLENLRIAHEMMKAMYAEELKNTIPPEKLKITFTVKNGRPI